MINRPAGRITIERTVWCGRCDTWDQESAPRLAPFVTEMRRKGWRVDGTDGWLCPTCAKEKRA